MRRQPIFKATLFVTVFWWSILTLWSAGFNLRDLIESGKGLDWNWSISVIVAISGGIIAGIFSVAFSIWFDRNEKKLQLIGKKQFGIISTIGPVPAHYYDLREGTEAPLPIPLESIAAIPEIRKDGTTSFLQDWYQKYGQDLPEYAALMRGLETVFMKFKHLPATHVPGGHGGRTLLAHSLLVSWFMTKLAPSHTYDGKIKRADFTITLPLKRKTYQFEPDDPLIALIGLVHDIGKIECYEYDAGGAIIGCRPDHDLTGGRIISRMPEFWELPSVDREVLHTVMSFYHHPQDVPTEDGYMVRDDRIHALLELLIRADIQSSRHESGEQDVVASAGANAGPTPEEEIVENNQKETLWESIKEILLRNDAINGPRNSGNLGFKRWHPQLKKDFLYLAENDFIAAVCEETGLENHVQKTNNPVGPVTKRVLKLLDEKGCLYTEQTEGGRNAESALYKVEFFEDKAFWKDRKNQIPAPAEERGNPKFNLASCIIVDCDPHFIELTRLLECKFMPVIGSSRLGARGRKKAANVSVADTLIEEALTGEPVEWENSFEIAMQKQEAATSKAVHHAEQGDHVTVDEDMNADADQTPGAHVVEPGIESQEVQAEKNTRTVLLRGITLGKIVPLSEPDESGKRVDENGRYVLLMSHVTEWLTESGELEALNTMNASLSNGSAWKCRLAGSFLFVDQK